MIEPPPLPPSPPPLPPHPDFQSEMQVIRMLELRNKMKSIEVAALLAIFVPVFGGFYASKITGFAMVIASVIFGSMAMNVTLGFYLFLLAVAYIVSIFSAVKQARLHNERLLEEAKRILTSL